MQYLHIVNRRNNFSRKKKQQRKRLQIAWQSVQEMCAASHKKVPNVLSQCRTKRRMGTHGRAHPSFGITPTPPPKKKSKKLVSYQKKDGWAYTKRRMGAARRAHPSFGMTPTQANRDLFVWRCPCKAGCNNISLLCVDYISHWEVSTLKSSLTWWTFLSASQNYFGSKTNFMFCILTFIIGGGGTGSKFLKSLFFVDCPTLLPLTFFIDPPHPPPLFRPGPHPIINVKSLNFYWMLFNLLALALE